MPQIETYDHHEAAHAACTATIEQAAFVYASQKAAAGTPAETNKRLDCGPIPKFDSEEALLAEQIKRQQLGSAPLKAFEITGKGSDEKYVKDAISSLETTMGLHSGRLGYIYFNDDHGNAQVFLEKKEKDPNSSKASATPEIPAPTELHTETGCIPSSQFVDKKLNHELLLPPNTNQDAALKVQDDREQRATRVLHGIPLDASADEAERINQDRLEQINQTVAGADQTPDQESLARLQVNILDGISGNLSSDEQAKVSNDRQKEATAIMLGLPQDAPSENFFGAVNEYNSTVDDDWNQDQRLPAGTSYGDAKQIIGGRLKQAALVSEGIDPNSSAQQIDKIQEGRQKQIAELAQMVPADDAQYKEFDLKLQAVKIGLPEDSSSADLVQEVTDKYAGQASAVSLGLPKDASQADIDAARALADPKSVPGKVCSTQNAVKPAAEGSLL